jgi:hypothetical protein
MNHNEGHAIQGMSFLIPILRTQEEHMVKAEITIGTCYGNAIIPVEVVGKGPRPGTVWVRALNGLEPFSKNSHGGPYQDSTTVIFIPHLRDVHVENDPEVEPICETIAPGELEVQISPQDHLLPLDWFLESAYEDRTWSE